MPRKMKRQRKIAIRSMRLDNWQLILPEIDAIYVKSIFNIIHCLQYQPYFKTDIQVCLQLGGNIRYLENLFENFKKHNKFI